jgi:hypothetical protein
LLAFLLVAGLAGWTFYPQITNALAHSPAAARPAEALVKVSITPTQTATPTATATFTPTITPTETPHPPQQKRRFQPPQRPRYPPFPPTQSPASVVMKPGLMSIYPNKWCTPIAGRNWSTVFLFPPVPGTIQPSPVNTASVKYEYTDMSGPGYYLTNVPYTMYFYDGYGLHGTYWHNNFGTPMSHGCVNLRTEDAQWLFEFASVGTPVNVHY